MTKKIVVVGSLVLLALSDAAPCVAQALLKGDTYQMIKINDAKFKNWLLRWERNILSENSIHYCSSEMGEEIGWKMSPFFRGFYYGYLATGSVLWVDRLVACADAWFKRAVKEPDGYFGWPKLGAAGTRVDDLDSFYADSMLGEAMALTNVVLMANNIRQTPLLCRKYSTKAEDYIRFSEQMFEKWDARGGWRYTGGGGMITVELPFGFDQKAVNWIGQYEGRNAPGNGFSHPNNKANLVASWLLAMFDVTTKPAYRERAEKWFQVMKSRMKPKTDGTYEIWNYWEPAGDWDYKNGLPKHWIGVHPNENYYNIDVEGIVAAYGHGLVFGEDDINRLIATAIGEKRYWTALVPYSDTIQKQFEDTLKPDRWAALRTVPWYLAVQLGKVLPR
jgi:hypothetical protein